MRHPVLLRALSGLSLAVVCATVPAMAAPPGTLPFGAYDPGGDFADDPVPVIEHVFLPWEDVFLPSLNDADAYALARNRALLITIEPWTWTQSERNTPEILREGIFNGTYDANMEAICGTIATLQSPATIRWGHEMEAKDSVFIWSNWAPQDYIRAFQRMTTICRQAAPQITVMWSPLGEEGLEAYYPGDEYVDLVGISVFGLQAFDQIAFDGDRSYVDVMAPRYARAAAFGKPVVIAELGYSGRQDYVDAWENSVRVARPEYPDIVGVVYFNQREVHPWPYDLGLPDWRLDERVTN
jgi:endoglucanase